MLIIVIIWKRSDLVRGGDIDFICWREIRGPEEDKTLGSGIANYCT